MASTRKDTRAARSRGDAQRELVALFQAGRPAELKAAADRHVRRWPDFAFGWKALGVACQLLGRDPLPALRRAASLLPDDAETLANLGNALRDSGALADADAALRRAVALNPVHPLFRMNFGNVLMDQGRRDEAIAEFRQSLAIAPDTAEAHNNLGHALFGIPGRLDEAIDCYRAALRCRPGFLVAADNLLFALNYSERVRPAEMRAAAEHYGAIVAASVQPARGWPNPPDPERPLRVGLVSGDLRRHPVGYLLRDVLPALDPQRTLIYAYATRPVDDDVSSALKRSVKAWHGVERLADRQLFERVREDRIDILVDLSGHTAHNRLPLFAMRPAPVQASWLGYFATTGLAAIDYFVGDPLVLPETEESHFCEKPWRLPDSYYTFSPPTEAVEVAPLPARARGAISFGFFGALAKLVTPVLDCWSEILTRLPGARLVIKAAGIEQPEVAAAFTAQFAERGIDAGRLCLLGRSGRAEHLAAYGEVDVALDSFPFPGGLTTLEASWMGVPTLGLRGDRFISHQGEMLLHALGLDHWIAPDRTAYVARAVALAGQLDELAALRVGLRDRLIASQLCDGARFAGQLEQAWRGMWRVWCESRR
ncbi:MAG: tetratricopeptide repeat protein [Rhodocyclaceae bacterium]|nr:tetratricopeptide repeat protein [Rhodocyclaceae bacterium]